MAILELFLEHPGELVTKETITARVWPDTFVEEVSLRVHISSLRRALGDGSNECRFLVTAPGRGYQFVAAVTREEAAAPMPVSAPAPMPNARVPLTRIIDRQAFMKAAGEQLALHRLVTITGPGGIGKTTVARSLLEQLMPRFPDGVHFVDLSPVRANDDVARTVARALSLSADATDAAHTLTCALAQCKALLILDSCERVSEGTAYLVEDLLRHAPQLRVLATSRERLRAEGERILRLPTLATPPLGGRLTAAEAMTYAAVQLFTERAADATGHFVLSDAETADMAFICNRLDGIPLAIELAAGHMSALDIPSLASLVDGRLGLLARGKRTALPRHQTLRAGQDWSFETLSSLEQTVLFHLAVFQGPITMAAARATLAAAGLPHEQVVPAIAGLVDKSLVVAKTEDSATIYRLLETTRDYAIERLTEPARPLVSRPGST